MYRKIWCILLSFLILGSILPVVNAVNFQTKKINDNVDVNQQNYYHNKNFLSIKLIYRIFFIGKIDNLVETENYINFTGVNIRFFSFYKFGLECEIYAGHLKNRELSFNTAYCGFEFRGILKDNFICGVFRNTCSPLNS